MQKTLQVLHTADLHLGHRQYGLHERERDIYDAFEEVVDIALREHVDMVIVAGDFFDSVRPPPQAILHAIKALRKLRSEGIPVVAVMGDHDMPKRKMLPPLLLLRDLEQLELLSNSLGTETKMIRTRSGARVFVAGLDNHKPAQSLALAERLRRLKPPSDVPSILVLHQSLREVSPEYELAIDTLPRGFSYYALGHLHLQRTVRVGDTYAAYPGSIEALRVDEAREQPTRYVLMVEVGLRYARIERVPLRSTRPQVYVEVDASRVEEEVRKIGASLALMEKRGKKPLLHLVVKSLSSSMKARLYTLLEQFVAPHVLAYRIIRTGSPVSERRVPILAQHPITEVNLDKLLEQYLGKERASVARDLLEALSVDPATMAVALADEVLRRYYKSLLGGGTA